MMRRVTRLHCIAVAVAFAAACSPEEPRLHSTGDVAQGTTYTIQWWTAEQIDHTAFVAAVRDELARLDALLSNYRDDSVIERFNQARTLEPLQLPEELTALLRTAAHVHRASAGCFEPTVRPLVTLWGLDGDAPEVADPAAITATLERIGFDKLEIRDGGEVRKTVADLELDLASIGQGYTVARMSEIAADFGLAHYLIELGGEIAARGSKPNGEPWRVGVEEPRPPGDPGAGTIRRRLTLPTDRPAAVITSGTYRHFFEADGRLYSHIIDPRTGSPVTHDLVSVTVVHQDPTLAAAWATALLCLGPEHARTTADSEGLAALLFVQKGESLEERWSTALRTEWPGLFD
jgi:thiamine biosynthesis lipoprotein